MKFLYQVLFCFESIQQVSIQVFTCETCKKNKERIKKFKETGDSRYIYQNKLDKACFQRDKAYGDFKDLNRRTFVDKVLQDKALNIAKEPKYDGCQRGLASMVYKFFVEKTSGRGIKS